MAPPNPPLPHFSGASFGWGGASFGWGGPPLVGWECLIDHIQSIAMDYFSGFISGLAQTAVGYPLDTIKVRRQLIGHMPISGLYAGVYYPALTAGLLNSVSFGIAGSTAEKHGHLGSGIIAGSISGLLSAPIEYYKIRKQMNLPTSGPVDLSRGPWRGNLALGTTVARDAIGYGAYFPVYYGLKDYGVGTLPAGAAAGMISWTVSYPLDTIKTGIQSGIETRSLWSGYQACMVRACLVNAVGWYVYEYVSTACYGDNPRQ